MSVLSVVAITSLLFVVGCSSTSARKTTAGNAVATKTPDITASATTPTTGGAVHLTDYTDNDGPTSTIILTGAIGNFGTAQRVSVDHTSQLRLMLSHGSFRLDITALDTKFLTVLGTLTVNTTTCSSTASVSEAVPVVAGSGTGSYKGISGTFGLTVTLDEVYKPTACSETNAYLKQSILVTGAGTVSFR